MQINTFNSKTIREDEAGNIFAIVEVIEGESWAVVSLSVADMKDGTVPFQTEALFDSEEECVDLWNKGWKGLLEGNWIDPVRAEEIDELTQRRPAASAAVTTDTAKKVAGVIKKPQRKI